MGWDNATHQHYYYKTLFNHYSETAHALYALFTPTNFKVYRCIYVQISLNGTILKVHTLTILVMYYKSIYRFHFTVNDYHGQHFQIKDHIIETDLRRQSPLPLV